MSRLAEYLKYHHESVRIGDVDPANALLRYVCNRFELNTEQRYWIAWLAAMAYCGSTTYYVYNEFPDAENVDVARFQRWWDSRGREQILVQTDRRWPRSRNQWVAAFESYRKWLGGRTQEEHFAQVCSQDTPEARSDALFRAGRENLFTFGNFALFIWTEFVHSITPTQLCPTDLDLDKAWSCRYGLFYAFGKDEWVTDKEAPLLQEQREDTAAMWRYLRAMLPGASVWNLETTLCAYRKWHRGKRYIGYYLDREAQEMVKMEGNVRQGVCWDVLRQYRLETYDHGDLAEAHGHLESDGVSRTWKEYRIKRTREVIE